MDAKAKVQYFCAVLLILSSIALAYIHEFKQGDIASGVLMYIAQAFLLAGSIFGLDYYVKTIKEHVNEIAKGTKK